MNEMLKTAVSAAQQAGEYMLLAANNLSALHVEQKSLHDYVSEVDRECERKIRDLVLAAYPDHQFWGEEFGLTPSSQAAGKGVRWIVDPLDGTTNFLRGIPHFAISIAVEIDGALAHGVIFDPSKNELFTASCGHGSFLNGKRLSLEPQPNFAGALLATGVPYSGVRLAEIASFSATMEHLLAHQTSGIRRLGSAALDLAYVAAGRYDGFWEAGLQAWDIAAGALLVVEAGGVVADFRGQAGYIESGDVVAAPIGVFEKIVEATSSCYSR